MQKIKSYAVTLIELVIGLALFSVIVLALGSIDIFSRNQVLSAQRRASIQSEVSLALEHMSKHLSGAAGNEMLQGINAVIFTSIHDPNANNDRILFRVDANNDGAVDLLRAYQINTATHQLQYCPNCTLVGVGMPGGQTCAVCTPAFEVIASHITSFQPVKPVDRDNRLNSNSLNVLIRACWNPDNPGTCGTPDNPSVNMASQLNMPQVAVH